MNIMREIASELNKPLTLVEEIRLQRRRVAWLRKHGASELPEAENCLKELLEQNREREY